MARTAKLAARLQRDLPADAVEVPELRTIGCKVYQLAPRKRAVVAAVGAVHVPDDVTKWGRGETFTWKDIDTDLEADGAGGYRVRSAWYALSVSPSVIGYSYTSKRQGLVIVSLETLDGQPVVVPQPRVEGHEIWWDNVATDLDIFIRCHADRVDIFKRLKSADSPKSFAWLIEESDPPILMMSTNTAGHDNADLLAEERMLLGGGRTRRHLELQHAEEELTAPRDRRRRRATETWTGRTFHYDKTGGQRTPVFTSDVVYPVLIDQDVSESIAAVGDDGYQNTTTWFVQYGSTGNTYIGTNPYRPGFRFQTVAIPAGATIDDATFTVTVTSIAGNPTTGVLFGNDTDDAPAWANSAGPQNMTTTTASVNPWTVPDAAAPFATDVTAIIAEIVARGGWATGNDISLGCQGAITGNFKYMEDLNGGAAGIATLEVNYTEAGGGGEDELTADDLASGTPTLGTPAIAQEHTLAATDLSTTPTLGTPALGQVHVLGADDLSTTPVLGTPTAADVPPDTDALEANGIASQPVLGAPTLGVIAAAEPARKRGGAVSVRMEQEFRHLGKQIKEDEEMLAILAALMPIIADQEMRQ